jgi:hypothetical protein
MGGACSAQTYKTQLVGWATNGNFFSVRALQMQNTMEVGWGLFSIAKTDTEALAAETSSFCGFPVGCQWKKITSRQPPAPGAPRICAVHFSVDSRYQAHDRAILTAVFHHSKKQGFPLGIFTWFVPVTNHTREDPQSQALAQYYKGTQEAFCERILNSDTLSLDFHTIDQTNPVLRKTAREYIMSIKTRRKPSAPLFLGINKHYQYDNWYVVSYKPRHRTEAMEVIDGLLSYMRQYEKPKDKHAFDSMFALAAVNRANVSYWDPTQYRIQNDVTEHYEAMQNNMQTAIDQELLSDDEDDGNATAMPVFEQDIQNDDETVYTTTTHVPMTDLPPDNPRTNEEIQQNGIALASRPSVPTGVPFEPGSIPANATTSQPGEHYEAGLLTQPSPPLPNPAPAETGNTPTSCE